MSLKLKRLQVNIKWSSFRQLAKISLFLPFYAAEKNFLLNQKDFFSETTSIFLHHTERKRSASYRNEMEMLHIVEL